MTIEKIKTFEEFKKELDFETTNKLTEIFQMIAKKDGFKATDTETGKDISDEVIENEIGMERIDIVGGIMKEEQIEKIGIIKNKLKKGEVLSRDEHDFCKKNTRFFENLKFKKVRRADPKWKSLLNNKN